MWGFDCHSYLTSYPFPYISSFLLSIIYISWKIARWLSFHTVKMKIIGSFLKSNFLYIFVKLIHYSYKDWTEDDVIVLLCMSDLFIVLKRGPTQISNINLGTFIWWGCNFYFRVYNQLKAASFLNVSGWWCVEIAHKTYSLSKFYKWNKGKHYFPMISL